MSTCVGTNANERSAFLHIELSAHASFISLQNWSKIIPYIPYIAGVCLVEKESGYDTNKLTTGLSSNRYGIFQISSNPKTGGCGRGYVGGACNIRCEGT